MDSGWIPLLLTQLRGCIDFDNEGLVGVWMDQERCAGKGFLEALGSLGGGRCPRQRLGLVLQEVG